ncbi:MAG: hypothetical protein NC337_02990 [Roseburia sp.]|nr:hypothetical protein [Roseburia sp.]
MKGFKMADVREALRKCREAVKGCENPMEWGAVIIITAFAMFTMFYSDFQGTMDFAFQVTRQIFHGDFGGVQYIAAHSYGMTMAVLLIVWMIPFYPFAAIAGEDFWYFGSLAGAVWSKLFLSLMTVFFVKAVCSIAKHFEVRREIRKWLPLFLLTSAFYFFPVVEIGQCDIIELTFVTWGLYYYLKEDTKRFLLFFAIAIPMKWLALMIFVPLVLLHQKNPVKIIAEGALGGSLFGVNLIIRKVVYGSFLGEFTSTAISGLTSTASGGSESIADGMVIEINSIENFFGPVIADSSVFIVVYLLICILAYAIKKDWELWAIYIPLLVFSCFLVLTPTNFYWTVLLLPFMTIMMFCNGYQLRLSMLLETIAGWAAVFVSVFSASWVIGGEKTFEYLFLRGIARGADVKTFLGNEHEFGELLPYANSAYVACIIGLLIINLPGLVRKHEGEEQTAFDRWIIWGRVALLFLWVVFLVYLLLIR